MNASTKIRVYELKIATSCSSIVQILAEIVLCKGRETIMIDDNIITALECCTGLGCLKCPLYDVELDIIK